MGSQFTFTARRTADASPRRATQQAEGTQTNQLGRASAAPQASLPQREFAAPGGTAVPRSSARSFARSLAGIPLLAPGEISPPPLAHPGLRLPLQFKLAIGAANDPLESEADAMAAGVMSMAPDVRHLPAPPLLFSAASVRAGARSAISASRSRRAKSSARQQPPLHQEKPRPSFMRRSAPPASRSIPRHAPSLNRGSNATSAACVCMRMTRRPNPHEP